MLQAALKNLDFENKNISVVTKQHNYRILVPMSILSCRGGYKDSTEAIKIEEAACQPRDWTHGPQLNNPRDDGSSHVNHGTGHTDRS